MFAFHFVWRVWIAFSMWCWALSEVGVFETCWGYIMCVVFAR